MKSNQQSPLWKLSLGAIGIVYGDIGTSPLYAVKECFSAEHGLIANQTNVLGVLSLIFWALTLVVTVKYLIFILRADNYGEGGILALLALLAPSAIDRDKAPRKLLLLGLFGAALLYGDGIITPAISVLSAVEGTLVITPVGRHLVVPITVGILIALFLVQHRGTGRIGAVFGPIMLVWFAAIGLLGLRLIVLEPSVLWAIDPRRALTFLFAHRLHGFLVLGAVVLCITGGEALYADMGHFGKDAIRRAWFLLVFPALLLNYFGQGALLLQSGPNESGAAVIGNPFFHMMPNWAVYPMVGLATVATIIASQALISGAFSLTRQAVQLGFWPRVRIIHTSGQTEGQIYIPSVNWALLGGCLLLVVEFRSSSGLAAAYGIAVTGTMAITSVLFTAVAERRWGMNPWKAGAIMAAFLSVDLAFLFANLSKISHGGWVPLVIGTGVFTMMITWRDGREILSNLIRAADFPLDLFLADLLHNRLLRVSGTAVFMTENPEGVPIVLLHHLKHCKSLHEQVVLLTVVNERMPTVANEKRLSVIDLGQGFYRLTVRHGFSESIHVPQLMQQAATAGLIAPAGGISYYLGHDTLLTTGNAGMRSWRKTMFAILQRNARSATEFFGLPPGRVVELGAQVEI